MNNKFRSDTSFLIVQYLLLFISFNTLYLKKNNTQNIFINNRFCKNVITNNLYVYLHCKRVIKTSIKKVIRISIWWILISKWKLIVTNIKLKIYKLNLEQFNHYSFIFFIIRGYKAYSILVHCMELTFIL